MFGHKDDSVACPDTGIIKEASRLPVTGAATGKEKASLKVDARIVDFSGGCREKTPGQVDMDLNVVFAGRTTAAGKDITTQDLPYFIAVLSPDNDILQRTGFSTSLAFDNAAAPAPEPKSAADAEPGPKAGEAPQGPQGVTTEQHTIRLPLAEGTNPADYKVVIGFALTPEQLQYDREQEQNDR